MCENIIIVICLFFVDRILYKMISVNFEIEYIFENYEFNV